MALRRISIDDDELIRPLTQEWEEGGRKQPWVDVHAPGSKSNPPPPPLTHSELGPDIISFPCLQVTNYPTPCVHKRCREYLPLAEIGNCARRISRQYTLEEIGDVFGISRERVRQIIERVVRRLSTRYPSMKEWLMTGASVKSKYKLGRKRT